MKKIIFVIFLLFTFILSAQEKKLYNLKNLSFQVEEFTTIEGNKRELIYDIVIEFPDKMKKIIVYPEINKGEIYLYNRGEKLVYLPFFNQIEKVEILPEENRVMEFIKTLMSMEKNNKDFKEKYYKNLKQKIELASGESVKINEREKSEGYFFPKNIEIFSGENKISLLRLSNFKSDIQMREDEFKIKNENSK